MAATDQQQNDGFGAALTEVTERTTAIVREEIELAKAEVFAKVGSLAKAAAAGAVAAVFALTGLVFLLHALSWGLTKAINNQAAVWVGYAVAAAILFILAAVLGLIGFRWVKKGTPPAPKMAIDEAKLVRETVKAAEAERPV